MMSLDAVRHAAQTAFVQSDPDLVFGTSGWIALPDDLCAAAQDTGNPVWLDGGLTARVRQVRRDDGAVALKMARARCLVQNQDGELSFVNELLRRSELLELAQRGRAVPGVTPTLFASLRGAVIVSPWIDGGSVGHWGERQLAQFFETGKALLLAGFFEWDFSPGNMLDDGRQLWLFDFGYMYRLDPLRQINTAGNGTSHPQFHLAERFESRNFFAHLLIAEEQLGIDQALKQFRLEKEIALETYRELVTELAARGATATVLEHLGGIGSEWQTALRGDLAGLYLREGWRSHEADLEDDLRGRSCSPMTLRRLRWLQERVESDYAALLGGGALRANSADSTPGALSKRLHLQYAMAMEHQLQGR